MKTPILLATAVLTFATLPAMSAETHDNENAEKIKALEAEIEALRAQLRAEGRIRGEDRNREHDRAQDRRPGPDHDRRQDGPRPRDMQGDQHRHDDQHRHEEQHRVMRFDLGDMSEGEMEGEIHIEISGDMGDMENVPHFVREMVMERMGRGEEGMLDRFMHMDEHERHVDDHERHEFIIEMDPRHMEPHHMDRGEEDPFFREGGEFVGKMEMSGMIADALSDPINVALFGVWEARQHLEPPQRLEILLPILQDDAIALPVRNAAAMVARESFVEIGDFEQARAVLALQIRINGSMN